MPRLGAVTLDLDDTLWPYAPVAGRIAAAIGGFLAGAAPRTAAVYDGAALVRALTAPRESRESSPVYADWMLEDGIRGRLQATGEDPGLAPAVFDAALTARQRVDLYPDVEPAIARLAARYKVAAITDGSSDVAKIGIAGWFDAVVTAFEVGASKPDARIFHHACAQLQLAPGEVLHAGDDRVKDVEGALDAGLQAAWVHRGNRAPGPAGALTVPDLLALADALGA